MTSHTIVYWHSNKTIWLIPYLDIDNIIPLHHYQPDINECEQLSPCGNNSNCTNVNGSYTCVCQAGFVGDGLVCKPQVEGMQQFVIQFQATLRYITPPSVLWTISVIFEVSRI